MPSLVPLDSDSDIWSNVVQTPTTEPVPLDSEIPDENTTHARISEVPVPFTTGLRRSLRARKPNRRFVSRRLIHGRLGINIAHFRHSGNL